MSTDESDLYADENEPSVEATGTETFVKVNHRGLTIQFSYDDTGLASLKWVRWNGKWNDNVQYLSGPFRVTETNKMEAMKFAWQYLSEWELVELKAIGPEDSEYFVTQNLKIRLRMSK